MPPARLSFYRLNREYKGMQIKTPSNRPEYGSYSLFNMDISQRFFNLASQLGDTNQQQSSALSFEK